MISNTSYKKVLRQAYSNKAVIAKLEKFYPTMSRYEVNAIHLEGKLEGLLFLFHDGEYYVSRYSQSLLKADVSGRLKPVVCDFCFTRLPGSKISRASFAVHDTTKRVAWLCCKDFQCSRHARQLTEESLVSSKLIGEDIVVDKKVDRLNRRIAELIAILNLTPISDAYEKV